MCAQGERIPCRRTVHSATRERNILGIIECPFFPSLSQGVCIRDICKEGNRDRLDKQGGSECTVTDLGQDKEYLQVNLFFLVLLQMYEFLVLFLAFVRKEEGNRGHFRSPWNAFPMDTALVVLVGVSQTRPVSLE